MSDKSGQTQNQAQVKIGHYILGDTLGNGTFGKVKGMHTTIQYSLSSALNTLTETEINQT